MGGVEFEVALGSSEANSLEGDVGNGEVGVRGNFPAGEGGGRGGERGRNGSRREGRRVGMDLEALDITFKGKDLERERMRIIQFQGERKVNPHWDPRNR